jgi:ABC-type transporter Mla MlaB component
MPSLPDGPQPDEVAHGRIRLDASDARVLHMSGDVDQPVVVAARRALTDEQLVDVDVIDLAGVTFVDSSLIARVATMVLNRPAGRDPLTVRDVPELALVVLEISGLLPLVAVTGRTPGPAGAAPESDAS